MWQLYNPNSLQYLESINGIKCSIIINISLQSSMSECVPMCGEGCTKVTIGASGGGSCRFLHWALQTPHMQRNLLQRRNSAPSCFVWLSILLSHDLSSHHSQAHTQGPHTPWHSRVCVIWIKIHLHGEEGKPLNVTDVFVLIAALLLPLSLHWPIHHRVCLPLCDTSPTLSICHYYHSPLLLVCMWVNFTSPPLCKAFLFHIKWQKKSNYNLVGLSAKTHTNWMTLCFKYLCPLHQQSAHLCKDRCVWKIWRPAPRMLLHHPAVYFNNFHFVRQLYILTRGPHSCSSFITSSGHHTCTNIPHESAPCQRENWNVCMCKKKKRKTRQRNKTLCT